MRRRVSIDFNDPSLAVQSEKDMTDINRIVARARATGDWGLENGKVPQYLDCTVIGDYRECLTKVKAAETAFANLGAQVRDRFANSPQRMVDFLLDPANRAEAEKLGLFVTKAQPVKAEEKPK